MKDFEHYLASMWNERNYTVVWTFSGIGMKTDCFHVCDHCWVFQICWHIECSTLTAASFRIWNSSAGIPVLSLALFVAMLPKSIWLHTPGYLALGEWPHHLWKTYYVVSFFIFLYGLCFKVYFVWYEFCNSCFLIISICMKYLFLSPHFQSVCLLPYGGSLQVAYCQLFFF